MLIYFLAWNLLAEFVVYSFTYLGIQVSTDNEKVVFWDATIKRE